MAGRDPICPYCGGLVDKDQSIQFKRRYYHKKCYEKKISEIETLEKERQREKEKQEKDKKIKKAKEVIPVIKAAVPEEIAVARENFYKKVKEISKTDSLELKIYAISDKFYSSYENMTWEGMTKALEYYYNYCENEPNGNVVGIIPYVYTEAERFYEQIDSLKPEERSLSELYKKKKIKIIPHKTDRKEIDISEIGV